MLTCVVPVACWGSTIKAPETSDKRRENAEFVPWNERKITNRKHLLKLYQIIFLIRTTSVSVTTISRLGRGVPNGMFSGISTEYSFLLNLGGSSFTSRIVIVTVAYVVVILLSTGLSSTISRA